MTQTLQQALLKAGLISEDKLKKAEADKKAAQRAAKMARQQPPQPLRKDPRANSPKADAAKPAPQATQRPARPAPSRPAPPKKSVGFIEGKHLHHIRTLCDACERSSPDVEYYEHRNRSLDKYWLCVRCADDNNILDEFRQTVQSSHAIKGVFRRNYGPTKVFSKK